MTVTPADLDSLMAARYSCRAFRPDPVPRPVIEAIVASARRVPSWCNAQPWQVTLTSGAETEALRGGLMAEAATGAHAPDLPFPESYPGVYRDRRRGCGWQLYEAVGVTKGDRDGSARQNARNFALFDAPHCAILSSPSALGPYGALDCGGFVTGFCLAAQAAGVATIPQAAVASFAPFLHRHFDIPEDRLILCAISFGYAQDDAPANRFRTPRAEVDEIVDWRG
ncbi:nitroreductase [Pseudodonghicola flavimaris]|uniref:Nitroreductase n=1 Tax=Pseudodonghicola flavimaris TaxID=3050036 RepID=A0ABT7F0L9_9RHOB|nr:nitroreductase [Pseudodonghicola flavimaris]MDK3018156.1 nitroreductase [Pseudodonghicola flavimaris]